MRTSFYLDSRRINIIANLAMIGVMVIVLSYTYYIMRQDSDIKATKFLRGDSLLSYSVNLPTMLLKPQNYYEQQINQRNIFKRNLQASNQITANVGMASVIPAVTENLKLKGIIFDKNPQAIIQNQQTQESFFVHKGDSIKEAIVRDITKGNIILEYRGQFIQVGY
jgi:type II secretory pathway component PulC